jgi:hypothetical protein
VLLAAENLIMARGCRPVDRDQQFLLPPDMREWLPASDPVWLVMRLIEQLDTSVPLQTFWQAGCEGMIGV